MKLLNHTLLYLSLALLLVISAWSLVFYFQVVDEVYDSVDDSLENNKKYIVQKALIDTSVLQRPEFDEANYKVREISKTLALSIRDTYKDSGVIREEDDDAEPVRLLTTAFHAGNGRYYELKMISSTLEEDDLLEDMFTALSSLYVSVLLCMLIINNVVLKKVWRPFYQLLDLLQQFRLGKQQQWQLPATKVKEFRELNAALDQLLRNAQESYNSQKQFIENAAHELQTPLAISINKVELLAERVQADEDSMHLVEKVSQNLERLTRLNKSLLLLSKIENRQFGEETLLNMNALVKTMADDFKELLDYKQLQLTIEEQDTLEILMNPDLAEILLSNLLKNAIVHNYEGGTVLIRISRQALLIENTGEAKALDSQKLFLRFYKESGKKNTTGLGLAIVKAIAERYDKQLRYSYEEGKHRMQLFL